MQKYTIGQCQLNGVNTKILKMYTRGIVVTNGMLDLGECNLGLDVSSVDLSQGATITLQLQPIAGPESD